MDDRAKKLKELIKRPAPKSTFGTNPTDPWSAKYDIAESALLDRYLKAKGINPKFVPPSTKVSHSKSNSFKKWAQDHRNEEVQVEDLSHTAQQAGGKTAERAHELTNRVKKHQEIKTPPTSMHTIRNVKPHQEEHTKCGTPDCCGQCDTAEDPVKEDVYQDPQAATQTVFDGANNTNDLAEKRKQLSKSARMIKALYRKHRMSEDLYDHEKEDKSVATYGKKPKMDTADKKDSMGENKPKAAAVVSGGTTLTGQNRDTIEIDPQMRVRPGQPDPTKKDDKKKDDDKKEGKKDK